MAADWKLDIKYIICAKHVLNAEGGYTNNPHDTGGPTNHGISWNNNAGYLKQHFGFTHPEEIRKLTQDQAMQVYYDRYWAASRAGKIPDISLALLYFDHAVNAGIHSADLLLRYCDAHLWYIASAGHNAEYWSEQRLKYIAARGRFYTECKEWPTFGRGWMNRLFNMTALAASKLEYS